MALQTRWQLWAKRVCRGKLAGQSEVRMGALIRHHRIDTPMTREADECGMVVVKGVSDRDSLFELAESLGSPISGVDGELIKELRVVEREAARPSTLSARFGTAGFPLHTDTAFWSVPARFVVMRVAGDVRRPTTVCSFINLFARIGEGLMAAARSAVWTLKTSSGPVYCGMQFRTFDGLRGFRYDRQCMIPANPAAREVDECICSAAFGSAIRQIEWSVGTAVVIANWQALHGRGPEPQRETERILQRIYVG